VTLVVCKERKGRTLVDLSLEEKEKGVYEELAKEEERKKGKKKDIYMTKSG